MKQFALLLSAFMQIFPFFYNLDILLFSEIVIFMIMIMRGRPILSVITCMITDRIGLHSVLLPLLNIGTKKRYAI